MAFALENAPLAELKALFSSLQPPGEAMRHGFFRASFVGPAWLRHTARPSLELSGLPGWQGKKFLDPEHATNVLLKNGTRVEHLAMRVMPMRSRVDGLPGIALTYPPQEDGKPAPIPWRWVRDELRAVDGHTILGMTVIELPLLRQFAFPFLLVREG